MSHSGRGRVPTNQFLTRGLSSSRLVKGGTISFEIMEGNDPVTLTPNSPLSSD